MALRAGAGDTSGLHDPDAALLRAIVDSIPARVGIVGLNLRYLYVNREFLEFSGRDAADVIGRPVADIIGPKAFSELAPLRQRVLAGETVHREGWLNYGDARPRYVQQIFTPYRSTGQDIEGYLVFARDLTDLKLRERELAEQVEALKANEAANAAVIASSLDCIVVMDEDGFVVEFNPAAEATFGYSRDEALGRSVAELIVPPGLRTRHAVGFARYLDSGEATILGRRLLLEAMRAGGETLPVELTITELRLPGRRLFAAHLRDLTAAKAAEMQIEQQRDRLHQVEKLSAMGSLLAGVAHELNNPLAIVLAQATLLKSKAATDDLRERAGKIHAAAARAGRIVKSFLAMARQKPPERASVDLNRVVEAALELTAYGRRSAGVEISVTLSHSVPSIEADGDMLGQVVANLLINAAQALSDKPGPRRITVETAIEGENVVLRVADNGPGIAPDKIGRIFDPYYTTKPLGVGTGIGLTISRNIVVAHGGELLASAGPDGGAAFEARIPLRAVKSSRPVPEESQNVALSVLVVDDEPDVAASLAEMLGELGHRPTLATDGQDALRQAEASLFDVIVADLRMPGTSGTDLIRLLDGSRIRPRPQVIIMTGDTIAGPELLARKSGDAVILEKPFAPEDVQNALRQALAARAHQDARAGMLEPDEIRMTSPRLSPISASWRSSSEPS